MRAASATSRSARLPTRTEIATRFCPPYRSQRLEQRGGARDVGLAGRVLDGERLHHAVLDYHAVTLRSRAEAIARGVERHVDRLGEVGIAVGQELDLVGTARLLPLVHDEAVVDRGDRDGVDALGLDGVGVLHEAG